MIISSLFRTLSGTELGEEGDRLLAYKLELQEGFLAQQRIASENYKRRASNDLNLALPGHCALSL